MTQKLRDERDSREQLAALKAALEAEGKTVVEEAGHYGTTAGDGHFRRGLWPALLHS